MKNSSSFAFAVALALTTAAAPALSQQSPVIDNAVVDAKPAAALTAPAMSSTIASTPPSLGMAKAPAAPVATADIRLPAPKLTLPATPPAMAPTVAKAETPSVTGAAPAKPAAVVLKKPIGTKAEQTAETAAAEEGNKPAKNTAEKKPADKKTVANKKVAEKAKEPVKKAGLLKKKEPPVEVSARLAPGEVVARTRPKFFFGLFDAPKPEDEILSPEQSAYDQKLATVPEKKKFKVKEEFIPVTVPFKGYKPGTIVIDTQSKYLYFVESPATALRYAVAVGKEGLLFTGKTTVGAKQPWPRWTPTKDMIARDPKKYGKYSEGMDGGPDNPLGARAIYLYQGKQDTYLRIHGTNQPQSIGTASSNGCFRMINEHVIDLYKRVGVGAEVVVL